MSSVKTIIVAPHPTLRQVAKEVTEVDAKILEVLKNLGATLLATKNPPGVGLAAPQIDQKWQAFSTHFNVDSTEEKPEVRLFINPKISDQSDKNSVGSNPRDPDLEGCLSIPSLYGPVSRPQWVTLSFQTLQPDNTLSDWHNETFFDFHGRVIQHELDHLNGILFTDHVLKQDQPLYQQMEKELVRVDPQLAKSL